MPKAAEPWSLTSLREKLIKIGAKVVSHDRYAIFQMAEVPVPRQMFQEILSLIRFPSTTRSLFGTGSPPDPSIKVPFLISSRVALAMTTASLKNGRT
jgi:hypothetical protein